MRPLAVAIVLAGLCVARPSLAGDSTWLVCMGSADYGEATPQARMNIAVSVFEHRSGSGDNRDLAVTLIRGDHVSRGTATNILDRKWSPLATREPANRKKVTFEGRVALAEHQGSIELEGTIDEAFGTARKARRVPLTAKLACETLDDLAIGH